MNLLFKASKSELKFRTNPGYLNTALNNKDQPIRKKLGLSFLFPLNSYTLFKGLQLRKRTDFLIAITFTTFETINSSKREVKCKKHNFRRTELSLYFTETVVQRFY